MKELMMKHMMYNIYNGAFDVQDEDVVMML